LGGLCLPRAAPLFVGVSTVFAGQQHSQKEEFMKLISTLCAVALGLAAVSPAMASEEIIKKARCVACHAVGEKRVGPAYKDVAAKYRGQDVSAQLFAKVRAGGTGVWGQIPMTPNGPDKISDADLKAAIDWILKLQ
jgi:cytochrome c